MFERWLKTEGSFLIIFWTMRDLLLYVVLWHFTCAIRVFVAGYFRFITYFTSPLGCYEVTFAYSDSVFIYTYHKNWPRLSCAVGDRDRRYTAKEVMFKLFSSLSVRTSVRVSVGYSITERKLSTRISAGVRCATVIGFWRWPGSRCWLLTCGISQGNFTIAQCVQIL